MSKESCLTVSTLKENFDYVQDVIDELKSRPHNVDKVRDLERLLKMQCELASQIKRLED